MTRRTFAAAVLYPAFVGAVAAWTFLLLEPRPLPEVQDQIPDAFKFPVAKVLHASVYAGLTVLAGLLPVPDRSARWVRLGLFAFLVLHGVGTEIGQTFVPNRSGRAWDVVIDWFGIAVGTLAVWATGRKSLGTHIVRGTTML